MESLIIYLASIFGVYLTFLLKHRFDMNAVRASAITIITVWGLESILMALFPGYLMLSQITASACGGSFVGMSSSKIISNRWLAVAFGIVYGWVLVTILGLFPGVGGELGTAACISVMACIGAMTVIEWSKTKWKA